MYKHSIYGYIFIYTQIYNISVYTYIHTYTDSDTDADADTDTDQLKRACQVSKSIWSEQWACGLSQIHKLGNGST